MEGRPPDRGRIRRARRSGRRPGLVLEALEERTFLNAAGMELQSDGKIVVGGSSIRNTESDFAIARFLRIGLIDLDDGTGGGTTTPFGLDLTDHFGPGLDLQDDDKAVIAGTRGSFGVRDVLLARYQAETSDLEGPTAPGIIAVTPDPRDAPVDSIDVVFSEPIAVASFTAADLRLTRDGQVIVLEGVSIALVDGTEATYRISGLAPLTSQPGHYELTIDASGIQDQAGNQGAGTLSESFDIQAIDDDELDDEDRAGKGRSVDGDYDGDGITDMALYRFDADTEQGVFEIRTIAGDRITLRIGDIGPGDVPIAGDFDGDGRADAAVFQPAVDINGDGSTDFSRWVIQRSGDGQTIRVDFGAPGVLDRPAPADFDGDGITDIATFRANSDLVPGAAQWFILPSRSNPGFDSTSGAFSVLFGAGNGIDLPAVADFDGDGRDDIATFRPVSDLVPGAAQWFILPSSLNDREFSEARGGFPVVFGAAGNADQPVMADFDGDGKADIAAYRAASDLMPGRAQWFILPSRPNQPFYSTSSGGVPATFGDAHDIAAPGDYDGDGRPDFAVYTGRGTWRIASSGSDARPLEETRLITFDPFGEGRGVPVLAPLFFRLGEAGASAAGAPGPEVVVRTAQRINQAPERRGIGEFGE